MARNSRKGSTTGPLIVIIMVTLLAVIACACGPLTVKGRVDVVASVDLSNFSNFIDDLCKSRETEEERDQCREDAYARFFGEVAR